MSIEKHKHWYLPLHIRNLSNLFACEFISPDSLLEDLGVGGRKQTPNFFQKDDAGLCLFDRPFRPQKFKDELRDLVWVEVDASYIKSMGSDDEIKFYSTGFDALSISFPLIINSQDFRFLFSDKKAIEKLRRLVKANPTSKLIGKYVKRFSTVQSGKDSAGIELKEFEENTFRAPERNSEKYKDKLREVDTEKGIYYAILLSKELSCNRIERKISSTLSRLRSLLSSINTEWQMSGEPFGPKLLSLFHEIMKATRLTDLRECSEQLLASDEFCGKFTKLTEDRELLDLSLAEVVLHKCNIDFSPFKKRLMDCHCESISKKSYESAVMDCKEEIDELFLSLEGRRHERISSLKSIGFRYDANLARSLSEDGDESELFNKILSVLRELKDPRQRKVDIDDIMKILTALRDATKGDDRNFVQEIMDSKKEGQPLSQPIEAAPPLLNFLHFLDFIGDVSGLETFINNMDDPPPHSYMAFAYWGAFNGFARMDESFAAPLFENLSVSLLSNIDRDIFRHHRPSPEKPPEAGQNSSQAYEPQFSFKMQIQDDLFDKAPGTITPDLQNAEITYYPTFIERNESDSLLRDLEHSVEWRQDKITAYGKVHDLPRLTAWYGDPGRNYNYSNIQMNPVAWTPTISKLKETVERVSNHSFNSLLLNYYRDGNDKVSWHSDDEKELGLNPTIASISLGAERKFKLRHKTKKELKYDIVLKHGSLLLMAGETQHHWEHEIPKTAVKIGPRINLTFRTVE